jgi:uncharacterized protein (TIGR03790 family)
MAHQRREGKAESSRLKAQGKGSVDLCVSSEAGGERSNGMRRYGTKTTAGCWRAILFFLCFSAVYSGSVGLGYALDAEQILVIANKKAWGSVGLAKYYMEKRAIPKKHLLQLRVSNKEGCSREEYDREVVPRVREFLQKNDPLGNIRCLVTLYGLPLKISPPEMTKEEKRGVEKLGKKKSGIGEELKALPKEEKERRKRLESDLEEIRKRINIITKTDYRSAFDSELALVRVENYPLPGWVPNPNFVGFKNKKLEIPADKVLMVSRLDGPNEEIVKRIINDSVEVEKEDLKGKAYFDARWPKPSREKESKVEGYAFYDLSIHLAAERVEKSDRMPVVLDDKEELFKEGACPDAALYCGWYSLARYVDAFSWKRGAVGYHIASSECETLKSKDSQVWCKRMLEKGVAATLGPVSEPYVQAFPIPEAFFGLLLHGRLTLAECYALSLPFLSWQMVLIGDPLYRPFK